MSNDFVDAIKKVDGCQFNSMVIYFADSEFISRLVSSKDICAVD